MAHSKRKLLFDLVVACEEIGVFLTDVSYEDFLANRILQLAIERQFEIIGEAIFRLRNIDPSELKIQIPEHERIIGLRNIISHGYDIIDEKILWDFAKTQVPELLEKIKNYK